MPLKEMNKCSKCGKNALYELCGKCRYIAGFKSPYSWKNLAAGRKKPSE